MPANVKKAINLPLLKTLLLDLEVVKNVHPVSNLTFLSIVQEILLASHFKDHLVVNKLYEPFQSAYRELYCTEAVVAILLDLSDALDTVDHMILIELLNKCIGVTGISVTIISVCA